MFLHLEIERELSAHTVRRYRVVIAPRVIAHERHARHGSVRREHREHLVRPRHFVGDRQLAHNLHPLHVALALADAHKVIRAPRRQFVRRRIRRPIRDSENPLRPLQLIGCGETAPGIIRVISHGIILRVQICRKKVLQIACALIQRMVNRRHKLRRRGIYKITWCRGREIKRTPFRNHLI